MADVSGEPGLCHLIGPIAYPLRHGGRLTFVHRSVAVGPGDAAWISALSASIEESTRSPLPSPLVALGRLNRVLDEPGRILADQAIDLATGLEAALAGTRAESEIGLRLRNRAAAFLSSPADPPDSIYRDVKVLYELRSAFVHGSSLSEDGVWKLLGKVSTATGTDWRGEQYELVLDRWRDLLRRAILFRLALGSSPDPLWPLAKETTDVDAAIVDAAEVGRWRDRALHYWSERDCPPPSTAPPRSKVFYPSAGPIPSPLNRPCDVRGGPPDGVIHRPAPYASVRCWQRTTPIATSPSPPEEEIYPAPLRGLSLRAPSTKKIMSITLARL